MATAWLVFGLSLAYATLRYNVFKGVAWVEWPTLIVNKAAALAALLLVVLTLVFRHGPDRREAPLSAARFLMLLHVALSLLLFGPASYESYFENGRPILSTALSMLLGALAAAAVPRLLKPATSVGPAAWFRRVGLFAFLAGLHAALLGYGKWFAPATWPGFLPPITLYSFLAGTLGLAVGLQGARRNHPPGSVPDQNV